MIKSRKRSLRRPRRSSYTPWSSPDPEIIGPLWGDYKSAQAEEVRADSRNKLIEIYFPYVKFRAKRLRGRLVDWAPSVATDLMD